MAKTDLKKLLGVLYRPAPKGPSLVDVPKAKFLAIDGIGDPNTAKSFADAVGALYSLSYGVKFLAKKRPDAVDYTVMPLEALWWTDRMEDFHATDKSDWKWTAMILQPDWIDDEMVETARKQKLKKDGSPSLSELRFMEWTEGECAQCLYVGPYSDEAPTIEGLHAFIRDQGMSLRGKHHEIYLNDMRRTDPARLKTIIRQPVA